MIPVLGVSIMGRWGYRDVVAVPPAGVVLLGSWKVF